MKAVVAILILALGARPGTAQAKSSPCLRYRPDTIQVSGVLARHMYYGAPGFGEDPAHDRKEVGFYLDLATPVCASAGAEETDVATTGIRRVQLVLDQAGFDTLRPFLGRTVTLRGTLFAAFTSHHHAPVLLDVAKPVPAQRLR